MLKCSKLHDHDRDRYIIPTYFTTEYASIKYKNILEVQTFVID